MCDNCGNCEACELKRSHKAINILGDSGNLKEMAPAYKLTYFNGFGLGEPIRFLLSYGGLEFEDDRFSHEDWPKIKSTMLFGQVPLLEVNGKRVFQSIAICRYLAKQVKLAGENDWENLEIDSIVDTITDLRQLIAKYHYEEDPVVKEVKKGTLLKDTLPYYLDRLDAIAKANDGHLALGRLTWADLYFTAILYYVDYMAGKDLTLDHPNLKAVKDTVFALPAIKTWVNNRPQGDNY